MDILRGILSDKHINIIVICFLISLFIYFRKIDYYKLMPRNNIVTAIAVGIWSYLSLGISPWFIIIGLSFLYII